MDWKSQGEGEAEAHAICASPNVRPHHPEMQNSKDACSSRCSRTLAWETNSRESGNLKARGLSSRVLGPLAFGLRGMRCPIMRVFGGGENGNLPRLAVPDAVVSFVCLGGCGIRLDLWESSDRDGTGGLL